MSHDSFDIGDATGAESKAHAYVPGLPLKVFFTCGMVSPEEFSEAADFTRRYVGELELRLGDPAGCSMVVVVPQPDGRLHALSIADVKIFFQRHGSEARVYVYDWIERQLILKSESYFDNPRRLWA